MLATGPRSVDARVKSYLADRAASDELDADIPEDVELTATGGGLLVPRRPWVQSMDGPEVSPPPALALIDLPDPTATLRDRVGGALRETVTTEA